MRSLKRSGLCGDLRPRLGRFALLALCLACLAISTTGQMQTASVFNVTEGHINFLKRTSPSDDVYTSNPSASTIQFMNTDWPRLVTFPSYWDQNSKLSWYPSAWAYADSYAIYTDPANTVFAQLIQQHPDWILRDTNGSPLYVNWACGGGTCPQYAANITNPTGYRAWWISQAQPYMLRNLPYKGLWIDDVNLDLSRVSDGNGNPVTPVDPNTGQLMTAAAWGQYFADFMAQVRAAFPNAEIVHNSLWYLDWTDPNVQREIQSADWINLERGVNDAGLSGGTGYWSFYRLLSFVDNVHTTGKGVIFDGEPPASDSDAAREYSASAYLLISSGKDMVGDSSQTPTYWWSGFNTNLGKAQGARYTWQGLWRRDFAGGAALVNPPGSAAVTVTLQAPLRRINGTVVSTVTLGAATGAILSSLSPCDVNQDGQVNSADVTAAVPQVLNQVPCGTADIDRDGRCTAVDVQRVINAVLGSACVSP
jgi:hypothetical protein